MGDQAVVGMRDGSIYSVNLNSKAKTALMSSHSDGEVWGLSVIGNDTVLTTGDDNKIIAWDVK